MLSVINQHLFPELPDQTRYNRRRQSSGTLNEIRHPARSFSPYHQVFSAGAVYAKNVGGKQAFFSYFSS